MDKTLYLCFSCAALLADGRALCAFPTVKRPRETRIALRR